MALVDMAYTKAELKEDVTSVNQSARDGEDEETRLGLQITAMQLGAKE